MVNRYEKTGARMVELARSSDLPEEVRTLLFEAGVALPLQEHFLIQTQSQIAALQDTVRQMAKKKGGGGYSDGWQVPLGCA